MKYEPKEMTPKLTQGTLKLSQIEEVRPCQKSQAKQTASRPITMK